MKQIGILVLAALPGSEMVLSIRNIVTNARQFSFNLTEEVLSGVGPDGSVATCVRIIEKVRPDVILACFDHARAGEVTAVLQAASNVSPDLPVLLLARDGTPEEVCDLVDAGIRDFLTAPFRATDLLPRLWRYRLVREERTRLLPGLTEGAGLRDFVGESPALLAAIGRIPSVAKCNACVLLTGETGTGKELGARAIHYLSPRSARPFVPVNCGAIPPELVENELFGHEAGAFTGASSAARGLIHDAEGGTLFLDEIDSLPLQTQVKFLRFLQDKEYRPLGGRKSLQADVRLIAASNLDLEGVVRSGSFRPDLFYRLNIFPLRFPALRDRREDIPLLARHFIGKYAREFSIHAKELSRAAKEKLLAYEWPGNVRELENIIQRALLLSEGHLITGQDICLPLTPATEEESSFKWLKARAMAEFEAAYLNRLLATNEGNISKAARAAKKNRRAFWELMRKHGIVATIPRRNADNSDKRALAVG